MSKQISTKTTIRNLTAEIKKTFVKKNAFTPVQTAASSTNGNVNIDGKEVVVYTEPENVLHDEDVEDFSTEEIAALLAD